MTNLKAYRKSKQLTQKEMADMLGISQVYYSYIESGKRNINNKILNKLTKLYPHIPTISSLSTNEVPMLFNGTFTIDKRWLENLVGIHIENTLAYYTNNNIYLIDKSNTNIKNNSMYLFKQDNKYVICTTYVSFSGEIEIVHNNKLIPINTVEVVGKVFADLGKAIL